MPLGQFKGPLCTQYIFSLLYVFCTGSFKIVSMCLKNFFIIEVNTFRDLLMTMVKLWLSRLEPSGDLSHCYSCGKTEVDSSGGLRVAHSSSPST